MPKGDLSSLFLMIEGQEGSSYADLARMAKKAEALGFGGLFRSDHWLPIIGKRTLPATDAWATLAGLAVETTKIRLGTLVSPMTFRRPSDLAKLAATVDQMSGGRLEVGFGTGWYEGEHQAYGLPFPPLKQRYEMLEEALEVCTALWSASNSTTYSGQHYSLTDAPGHPKPIQNPLPVIVGGRGARRTPEIAARYAHEYNTGAPLQEWIARCANVRAACERSGRGPASLRYTRMTATMIGLTEASAQEKVQRRFGHGSLTGDPAGWLAEQLGRGALIGGKQQVRDTVAAYAEAGCSRTYLQIVPAPSDDEIDEIAEIFR